ncbi:hypothetical protein GBAR_LOCUS2223 [Geodia barretti]|uniref:Uncharacterized protein n=1 Tax=Geodia barretti TaxID=519541 RepID=A0AA35W6J1_GEOBA|nr:hypothetical protein GBAR_LOCUS2223 [Geodia barretti]
MSVFVRQIQVAVRTEDNGGGPYELARRFPPTAELANVIAVQSASRYPHRFRLVGIGATGNVQQTIGTKRHRNRTAESRTAARQQADHVVVLVQASNGQRVFDNRGHFPNLVRLQILRTIRL